MDLNTDDKLKALLARKRTELAERLMRETGEISPADIAPLEAIRVLLEIGPDGAKSARHSRYVQMTIAAIIALVIITLLLLPLRHIDFALEAEVRSLRFKTIGKEAIALPLSVERVVVQGQAKVYVPSADAGKAVVLLSPIVYLATHEAGAIKLELPQITAGTKVEITRLPADGSVEVTLCGIDEPGRITVAGPVTVTGESSYALLPNRPTSLLVVPRSTQPEGQPTTGFGACGSLPALRYRFVPEKAQREASDTELELITNLAIRDLELISEAPSQDGMLRPHSSIVSGRLRITSAGRKVRELSQNEFLVLERNSGELLSFFLKPGALRLFFEGSASGLYVGTPNKLSSIMPTLFEWLQSRDQIVLAWSTGLSALGLLLGLYSWYRKTK